MDIEALRRSPIGKLSPIGGTEPRTGEPWTYWAYVPDPLSLEPQLNFAAIDRATQAAMEVARLDQATSQLPRPDILIRPILRREAVSTAALEGTYAAFDEVLEADFEEEKNLSSEQREIRNYIRATEQAIRLMDKYPISRPLAGRLQRTIVTGTSGETYDIGDLRQRQVCIGPKHRPIQESRFVPPPPGIILEEGFSEWEKWVSGDNHIPVVIRIALAHYQFETLHPFADGNGRLGRLIAILQLIQAGVLKLPVINLAPWLDQHRDEYQQGLLDVTLTGDFNPWVIFIAEAIRVQALEGVQKIGRLLALRDEMIAQLRAANLRGSALQIAGILIGYPVINVRTASELISRSFETTNQGFSKLVEHGILKEMTGRTQDRLFICNRARALIIE